MLRIVKRPIETDPVLSKIIDDWVRSKTSLAALIDNSQVFSAKFADFVTKDADSIGAAIKNLGHANHRFESICKPLGRLVHFVSAAAATASWIATARTGNEVKRAKHWLAQLDDQSFLLAALLADASHETMQLLRYTDSEHVEPAEINEQVKVFLRNIEYLFGESAGCLKVKTFTSFALESLKTPKIFRCGHTVSQLGKEGQRCSKGVLCKGRVVKGSSQMLKTRCYHILRFEAMILQNKIFCTGWPTNALPRPWFVLRTPFLIRRGVRRTKTASSCLICLRFCLVFCLIFCLASVIYNTFP
jgi:hypothetical protein